MSEYEFIEFATADHVATITLNRPRKGNGLSIALLKEFNSALTQCESEESIRVVVLKGNGKNFCVGADLTDVQATEKPTDEHILEDHAPNLHCIRNSKKIYICAMQGAAAGIGSAYALVCDMTVMADNAYIYQAFLPIGMVPDGGATWLLGRHLGYKRAFKMIIEGTKLGADQCLEWGLASDVVPANELDEYTRQLASNLAGKAPLAMAAAKQLLNGVFDASYGDTVIAEARQQRMMHESADCKEGVSAFLEKRTPVFRGE
ncbi:MAG: enoyl-CoA hydratase/isomerase family protein [Pseudomonadales bacterium]